MKLPALIITFLWAVTTWSPAQTSLKEPWYGFRIQLTGEWIPLPGRPDEPWLLEHFHTEKEYTYNLVDDSRSRRTRRDSPELRVFVLPMKEGGEKANVIANLLEGAPEDYLDYLKRLYSDDKIEIQDASVLQEQPFPVASYEASLPTTSWGETKILLARTFHLPHVQVVLEFKMSKELLPKLKQDAQKIFHSFRCLEEDPSAEPPEVYKQPAGDIAIVRMNPIERAQVRSIAEETLIECFLAALPESWKTDETDEFVIASNGPRKFYKQAAAHGRATLAWLEDNFGYIGKDEFLRRPILVLFEDYRSRNAYVRDWIKGQDRVFICTTHPRNNRNYGELGSISQELFLYWFQERDLDYYQALPRWLKRGIYYMLARSVTKGRELDFQMQSRNMWSYRRVEAQMKSDDRITARDLVYASDDELEDNSERGYEAAGLVYLLMEGKKAPTRKSKGLVDRYARALHESVDRHREQVDKAMEEHMDFEKSPSSARRKVWVKFKNIVNDEARKVVFEGWTAKDWAALDKKLVECFQ